MSEQTSKTAIGAFVIGALALAVLGALVFGSGKFFEKTNKCIMYFDGSVKGLNEGAAVAFRGVKVGSVKSVVLRVNPKDMSTHIPVIVEIEADRIEVEGDARTGTHKDNIQKLVDQGMRAQLKLESLVTGKLMIELDYHPDTEIRLLGGNTEYVEVPTLPSDLQQLARKFMDLPVASLFNKLMDTVDALNKLVESPQIPEAIGALKVGVEDTKELVEEIKKQAVPLIENLNLAVEEYSRLAKDTNDRLGPLISGMEETVGDFGKLARKVDGQVDPLAKNADEALNAATSALNRAERTIEEVGEGFSKDSAVMTELRKTLRELSSASRSIRDWADYLERNPEALIRGKGNYRR